MLSPHPYCGQDTNKDGSWAGVGGVGGNDSGVVARVDTPGV